MKIVSPHVTQILKLWDTYWRHVDLIIEKHKPNNPSTFRNSCYNGYNISKAVNVLNKTNREREITNCPIFYLPYLIQFEDEILEEMHEVMFELVGHL